MTDDHDSNDGAPDGFQFISPAELIRFRQQQVDQYQMGIMEFKQSVDRLMDELTPDQCFTMYRLLQNISGNGTGVAEFFSGQAAILLRRIHKICMSCGNTEHTSDEHAFLEMGQKAVEELRAQGITTETVNEGDFSRQPDESLTEAQMLVKYDVMKIDRQGHMYVVCHQCDQEYPTLRARAEQGVQCPGCEAKKLFNGEANA